MADRDGDQGRSAVIRLRAASRRPDRQASEQNRTSSQVVRHFLRQVNGRPQPAQILVGSSAFLGAFGTVPYCASAARATVRPVRRSTTTTRSGPAPESWTARRSPASDVAAMRVPAGSSSSATEAGPAAGAIALAFGDLVADIRCTMTTTNAVTPTTIRIPMPITAAFNPRTAVSPFV